MEIIGKKSLLLALMVGCGTAASTLIGLVLIGNSVLLHGNPAFQCIMFGFVYSVLVTAGREFNTRIYICCAIAVILLLPFSTNAVQKLQMDLIIRDLVYGLAATASVLGARYLIVSRRFSRGIMLEIALWTLSIVIAYIFTGSALAVIFKAEHPIALMQFHSRLGLLIGPGVSAGTIGCAFLSGKLKTGNIHSR